MKGPDIFSFTCATSSKFRHLETITSGGTRTHLRRRPELEERRFVLADFIRGFPDLVQRVLLAVQMRVDLDILPVCNLHSPLEVYQTVPV